MVLENTLSNFKKPVEILWEKVFCPICSEPTGKKSQCHNKSEAKELGAKEKFVSINKSLHPIFGLNCVFKENNDWKLILNYPFSSILIQELQKIDGVENLAYITKYKFKVTIGSLFDEAEVKKKVAMTLRALFKQAEVMEINLNVKQEDKIIGISLPNGSTYMVGSKDEIEIVKKLNSEIPKSELIKGDSNE